MYVPDFKILRIADGFFLYIIYIYIFFKIKWDHISSKNVFACLYFTQCVMYEDIQSLLNGKAKFPKYLLGSPVSQTCNITDRPCVAGLGTDY